MSSMILLNGLNPKVNLKLDWTERGDGVLVCTSYNEEIVVMGKIELTASNLSKLKYYQYALLNNIDGKGWEKGELNYTDISRPYLQDEDIIKVDVSEGGDEIDENF